MGPPFLEMRGALMHRMVVAGFSAHIVAAAAAVTTRVEGMGVATGGGGKGGSLLPQPPIGNPLRLIQIRGGDK